MRNLILGITSGFLMLGAGNAALANSPPINGLWAITFYIEPGRSTGATQCLNFAATNDIDGVTNRSGTWTSTTFSGWGGQWIQEGDYVRFWGEFGSGTVSTTHNARMENASHMGGTSFTHFYSTDGSIQYAGSFLMNKNPNCVGGASTTQRESPVQP